MFWFLSFFWSGKHDLVACQVVYQPNFLGGFSVVGCQAKIWALRIQWVCRFVASPASWSSFMIHWFSAVFAVPPQMVFSFPFFFVPDFLPPIYHELVLLALLALVKVSSFVMCCQSPVSLRICISCLSVLFVPIVR